MPRDSMPPYTIRVASVVTSFPGAGPERVEALITSKIEEVAQELPELKTVTSESRTGLSVVSVALKQEVPSEELQAVWDRLRRKIDTIRSDLPEGIRGPEVKDDGIGVVYGIVIGLTGDGFTFAELETYAKDLRDDLIKLPDAAEVKNKRHPRRADLPAIQRRPAGRVGPFGAKDQEQHRQYQHRFFRRRGQPRG